MVQAEAIIVRANERNCAQRNSDWKRVPTSTSEISPVYDIMGLQRYRGLWKTHNSFKIYICLVLLILASQRIEDMIGWEFNSNATKRGASPSLVESFILAWVAGKLYINSISL